MSQKQKWIWTLLAIGITIALYFIPFGQALAYPLLLLSTVAHELGHGIAALLVGRDFELLHMEWNGSGYAMHSGPKNRLALAFTSAGGLLGPSLVAAGCFVAARGQKSARMALALMGAVLALVVVTKADWGFTQGFLFLTAAALLGAAKLLPEGWTAPTLVFLAIQLSLSVFSRGDYLFTDTAGSGPSDVAQMAQNLFLPYWFWGLFCGGLSLVILALGVGFYLYQDDE